MTLELDARRQGVPGRQGDRREVRRPAAARAIGHLIEDPLSEGILRGEYAGRNHITADVQEEEGKKNLIFRADNEPVKAEPAAAAAAEATGDST